jgi:hypothetical protein
MRISNSFQRLLLGDTLLMEERDDELFSVIIASWQGLRSESAEIDRTTGGGRNGLRAPRNAFTESPGTASFVGIGSPQPAPERRYEEDDDKEGEARAEEEAEEAVGLAAAASGRETATEASLWKHKVRKCSHAPMLTPSL